jgi:hypothetical protein
MSEEIERRVERSFELGSEGVAALLRFLAQGAALLEESPC